MRVRIFYVSAALLHLAWLPAMSIAQTPAQTRPAGSTPPQTPRKPPVRPTAARPTPANSVATALLLPPPVLDPLRLNIADDPVLGLARATTASALQDAIRMAIDRNPALDEAAAQVYEARGARNEAEARRLPTIDLSLSHYEIISRAFSNDSQNIIERSRPRRRTDALAAVQQTVFDFGANLNRVRAADQRLVAARQGTADAQSQLALHAIGSWYSIIEYRTLLSLTVAFLESQRGLRSELDLRITQGYSAQADLTQVDSYIAATNGEIAEYQRRLDTAQAQFAELVGNPPPADMRRAPPPLLHYASVEDVQADAERSPAVIAAEALARSAVDEAKASRADQLPRITAAADIGRYGALENARDYDARVTGTLAWRPFGGGAKQRAEQAEAREQGAEARAARIREEVRRDAAIAFTDLLGLEASERAMREGYIAARRSRDVTAERFKVSRGTLFDLVAAENAYYSASARYILALNELDTARYALLARTGRLIEALGILTETVGR